MVSSSRSIFLILHNIRSVHNVGGLFRTADAAGVSKIFLVGFTPTPLDRFGRPRKDFAKTSLGAEKTVSWESVKTLGPLVKKLKGEGVQIVGLELAPGALHYKTFKTDVPVALVLGNEVSGLTKKELDLCDTVIQIPMAGKKESLNVGVAGGIALFSLVHG